MVHPQYRVADHADDLQPEQSLTPIYPLTTGWTQQRLRQLIAQALELATRDAALLRALPGLDAPTTLAALQMIHLPKHDLDARQLLAGTHAAQRRLKCEELLAHQLSLRVLRQRQRSRPSPILQDPAPALAEIIGRPSFVPTAAPRKRKQ